MTAKAQGPAPCADDGGVEVRNVLPVGHRYREVAERALRTALGELSGRWEASVRAYGSAWFRIDLVAPDGATASLAVPVHEGPNTLDLADAVRVACARPPAPQQARDARTGRPK